MEEVVEDNKYVSVHLDNRLDWVKKRRRIQEIKQTVLLKFRLFLVCSTLLHFYESVVQSTISSAIISCNGSVRARDLEKSGKEGWFRGVVWRSGRVGTPYTEGTVLNFAVWVRGRPI